MVAQYISNLWKQVLFVDSAGENKTLNAINRTDLSVAIQLAFIGLTL